MLIIWQWSERDFILKLTQERARVTKRQTKPTVRISVAKVTLFLSDEWIFWCNNQKKNNEKFWRLHLKILIFLTAIRERNERKTYHTNSFLPILRFHVCTWIWVCERWSRSFFFCTRCNRTNFVECWWRQTFYELNCFHLMWSADEKSCHTPFDKSTFARVVEKWLMFEAWKTQIAHR